MGTFRAHLRYALLLNSRTPGIWTKLLVTVPVMEVLPYLFMGHAFLPESDLSGYLYANMLWSFFSTVVIQCLVALGGLSQGGKLDLFLLSDGSIVPWLCGYATGVCVLFLASTAIVCGALGVLLGYPVHAAAMLGLSLLSLPVTLALVFLVFGIEIRWGRTFHVINLALDVLQVLSCVAYPLAAMGALAPLAAVSPITWLNEFARTWAPDAILLALAISAAVLIVSVLWVRRSVRAYRTYGRFGG